MIITQIDPNCHNTIKRGPVEGGEFSYGITKVKAGTKIAIVDAGSEDFRGITYEITMEHDGVIEEFDGDTTEIRELTENAVIYSEACLTDNPDYLHDPSVLDDFDYVIQHQ